VVLDDGSVRVCVEKLQGFGPFGHVTVCMKCDCFEGVTTSKRIKDKRKDEATSRESPPP
jgi:hypothetical protein